MVVGFVIDEEAHGGERNGHARNDGSGRCFRDSRFAGRLAVPEAGKEPTQWRYESGKG